jgi:hypothetical protein
MVRKQELEDAMDRVAHLYSAGPTWAEWIENIGIDPNDILACAQEHAETVALFPQIFHGENGNAVSFGSGFTLAVMVMTAHNEKLSINK